MPTSVQAVLHRAMLLLVTLVVALGAGASAGAEDAAWPERPITVVVAFGVGGSADRMTRAMARHLGDELGQPVQVINRKGAGTLLGSAYVLEQPDDGYTLLASTFSPYLSNTILEGNASYTLDDFAYLNFQWFDEDLLALYHGSEYRDLPDLLHAIRTRPKTVRAAVVRGSAGHLMAKLLLEVNGIPQDHLNLVTYNSGGMVRAAVAGGVVDFTLVSAEGCETIREYLRPLAIVSDEPSTAWQAPTLNQALAPLGVEAPVLPGSIRGFGTSAAFRARHPERYATLVAALRRVLDNPEVRAELERMDIGHRWVGPERAERIMRTTYDVFSNYSHLLAR